MAYSTTYSPLLLVHMTGGVVGMLSGAAALIFRKGSEAELNSRRRIRIDTRGYTP